MSEREPPELLSEQERKEILADAERLWRDLQSNKLGGYSDGNRPFYILHEFKAVIEKYGKRDVGSTWSKNDLDALAERHATREGDGTADTPIRIWAFEDRSFTRRWRDSEGDGAEYVRADTVSDLLRTAAAFIEELKAFGYGESSEKALPGAYDPFVQAIERMKG